jgi:hypothetical protein
MARTLQFQRPLHPHEQHAARRMDMMKGMVIVAAALALGIAANAHAEDPAPQPTPKMMPPEVEVKVQAPPGTSDEDIAAGIRAENAKRDPVAQQQARAAKEKADADAAHAERVRKICESIPEKSKANDPSLRKMCD